MTLINFNQHPLFLRFLDITSSPYKANFREEVIEISKESLIQEIRNLIPILINQESVVIKEFFTTDKLNQLFGDGHYDKETSFKELCHEMEAMVYDVLDQEIGKLNFNKACDLKTGEISLTYAL